MMLLLGILDLIGGANFVLLIFGISIKPLIIALTIYLLLKSIVFIGDLASFLDTACAIILAASYFFMLPQLFYIAGAIILIQKGIFSLV